MPTLTLVSKGGAAEAPVLLLGPSLGTGSGALWAPVIPVLAEDFRVITWDLPGHGASAPTSDSFSVDDLADAIAAELDHVIPDAARVHYAGVSLGGAVGLTLALRHAHRLERASIVASGAQLGTPQGWTDRAELVRASGTAAVRASSAERWFAPGFLDVEPEVADRLLTALGAVDDESYALCCEALAAYDVRAQLPAIRTPLLVAWGEFDVVAPEPTARTIVDAVADAAIVEIVGAAHLPPSERPSETLAALLGFHRG